MPSTVPSTVRELILALFDIKAICLDGPYTLKSGIQSPIYVDLRVIISYPHVLKAVTNLMWQLIEPLRFSLVCGVPYTALPIATLLSVDHGIPMVMRRKEVKEYGLKKAIEGHWKQPSENGGVPEVCLIIEDLVTSGLSVYETILPLQQNNIAVNDIIVLLDREQGGKMNIEKPRDGGREPMRLHSVMKISEVIDVLLAEQRISAAVAESVRSFVRENQVKIESSDSKPEAKAVVAKPKALAYEERAALSKNAAGRTLLSIMHAKQTNLCLSADVTSSAELLRLADICGPYICMLKTHVDILEDYTPALIESLRALATKHNYLLFEDRKYADIGSTVVSQYKSGIYHVSAWSHITNAHIISGPGVIDGLRVGCKAQLEANELRGLLLIAEMSSEGTLAKGDYTKENIKLAEKHDDFVIGFICQNKLSSQPHLIHMTPGVSLPPADAPTAAAAAATSSTKLAGDGLGQQYNTPADVIANGTDVIIVGRGIYAKKGNEVSECQRFKEAGWSAYLRRFE